jgi:hypothetical protein
VNTLGANYTMGAFKILGLNQTNKNTGATTTATTVDTTYTALTGQYTTGNFVVMASTGTAKADAGTNAGKKSKLTGFGVDYNLSKTTALYLRSESIKDDAVLIAAAATTDVTGNTKRTRTAFGLRTSF